MIRNGDRATTGLVPSAAWTKWMKKTTTNRETNTAFSVTLSVFLSLLKPERLVGVSEIKSNLKWKQQCQASPLTPRMRRFGGKISGQISFGEWTAMMVGRVGRDNNTFNCGGRHGLSQYLAVFNGLACDFCQAPIRAGYLAKGCRQVSLRVAPCSQNYLKTERSLERSPKRHSHSDVGSSGQLLYLTDNAKNTSSFIGISSIISVSTRSKRSMFWFRGRRYCRPCNNEKWQDFF